MQHCIRSLVAIFITLLLVFNRAESGAVSGAVFGTWTLSQSPYIVTGETYVPSGRQLIIEPGVAVRFTSGASFTIYGNLVAIGHPNSVIEFTGYLGAIWDGLRFQNTNYNNNLDNVIIRNANLPLHLQLSTLTVTNSIIEGITTGVVAVRSTFQSSYCTFTIVGTNSIGVNSLESELVIHNNLFEISSTGFAQNGIGMQIFSGSPNIQYNVLNVTATSTASAFVLQSQNVGFIKRNLVKLYSPLENNGFELSDLATNVQIHHNTLRVMTNGSVFNGALIYTSRNVDIRNNIFWGRGVGVGRQTSSGVVNWNYNLVYGFTENYSNGIPGVNDLQRDPLLDEQTYYPTLNSPVINAGDPTLPFDPDGTIADIGAYYYLFTKNDLSSSLLPLESAVQIYPNPFNSTVHFRSTIFSGYVQFKIYNHFGQLLYNEEGYVNNGMYHSSWTPKTESSGTYFLEITNGNKTFRNTLQYIK